MPDLVSAPTYTSGWSVLLAAGHSELADTLMHSCQALFVHTVKHIITVLTCDVLIHTLLQRKTAFLYFAAYLRRLKSAVNMKGVRPAQPFFLSPI